MSQCACCNTEHTREEYPDLHWRTPIPRILHHVWLTDNPTTPLLDACYQSFVDMHPNWSRVMHKGPDVFDHPFFKSARFSRDDLHFAYDLFGKIPGCRGTPWGARSDLVRLAALYVYGGFYVDYDLFCIKPLDDFKNDDLVLANCIDDPMFVSELLIGCHPLDPRIEGILKTFLLCDVRNGMVTPRLTCWAHIYGWPTFPAEYFCPHNPRTRLGTMTKPLPDEIKYARTENTHAIHCWKEQEYDIEKLQSLQAEKPVWVSDLKKEENPREQLPELVLP